MRRRQFDEPCFDEDGVEVVHTQDTVEDYLEETQQECDVVLVDAVVTALGESGPRLIGSFSLGKLPIVTTMPVVPLTTQPDIRDFARLLIRHLNDAGYYLVKVG